MSEKKYTYNKNIKKLYLTCNRCKASNSKVRRYDDCDEILCIKCRKKYLEKLEEKENIKVKEDKNNNIIRNEQGKIMCNECGLFFDSLGGHVKINHGLTIKEYRKKYNIPIKRSLTSIETHKILSDRMKNVDMEKQLKRTFHHKRTKDKNNHSQMSINDLDL